MDRVFDVRMRDGTLLSTEVLTPASGGPWPVLVARTPYAKSGMARGLSGFVQHGYAIVVQDVRGTGQSPGIFRFLSDEAADAADTGKWILEQPFFGGSIGLIGISYLGGSSVGMASSIPENVRAAVWIAPVLGGQSLFHAGGALRLHHNLPWTLLGHPKFRELEWRILYGHLPLKDALRSVGVESWMWDTICSFAMGASTPTDLAGLYRSLKVPGLYFGGFWDFMLDASLSAWEAAGRIGGAHAMFLGPWTHNGMVSETTRNEYVDYGQEASAAFGRRTLQWFDHHLKGVDLSSDLSTSVSAYLPGAGWIGQDAWPCPASAELDLYLGRGTLDPDPAAPGALTYVYDPGDPVPTEGGALWEFPRAGLNPGPAIVTTTGSRQDVMVFQGAELGSRVTALGPAEIVLHVASDAPSTDFAAKLVDVYPDGTPRIVADAVRRTNLAGEAQVSVAIPGIGHVFEKGHRIRLDVSSSNFPKYDRNLNTGLSDLVSSKMKVARQTVRFGRSAPSRVRLHVLDD